MPRINVGHLAAEFPKQLTALADGDKEDRLKWAELHVHERRFDDVLGLNEGWQKFGEVAKARRKGCLDALAAMANRQQRIVSVGVTAQRLATETSARWKPLRGHEDWPAMRAGLEHELESRGVPPAKIKKAIERMGAVSGADLSRQLTTSTVSFVTEMNWLADAHISVCTGADLAVSVARFNRLCAGEERMPSMPKNSAQEIVAQIKDRQRKIWEALRTGRWDSIARLGRDLVKMSDQGLDDSVVISALLARRRRAPRSAWALGMDALSAGNASRSSLHGLALGRYLHWLGGWSADLKVPQAWLRAAQLAFASKYKRPRTEKISKLVAEPKRFDGREVTIEGLVGAVQIVHRGKKVVSSAGVSDAEGAVARIGLPYIKLDSGGVAAGAYAQVSGTWFAQHKDFSTPVLVVDRRAFEEDGKTSFEDWAESEVNRLFVTSPHNLMMAWCWQPGIVGAANQLRFGTWFRGRRL